MTGKDTFLPAALALLLSAPAAFSASGAFGYTEPAREVKMSFPETGVISELNVQEGQQVKKDDILAREDYRVLQKELEISRKETDLQSDRLSKLKPLAENGRVSPEELKRAETDLEVSRLKAERTEAQIENRTLRSPFNGLVTEIKKEISESVSPSDHVLTVVELDELHVKMFLPPEEASRLQSGAPVTLYLPENGRTVPAKVDFISPVRDAASNTVRVKFVIDNTQRSYKSGVRCELNPPSSSKSGGSTSPSKKNDKEFIYQ